MSITSKSIDYVIKTGLHPVLKQDGFRKSSRTFRRVNANCTQIVNIQGSWTNYDDQGQFTINLAVYFPEAVNLDWSFRATDRPLGYDTVVNQRIGRLMPVQSDYWWNFDTNSDLDQIAKEVVFAWLNYGKSWIEKCSTPQGALEFVLSRKMSYWASVFALMIEDRDRARQYLVDAIQSVSQNPDYKSRLEDWGHSKGLLP